MALKKFLMAGIVAAVLVACGDDDSSGFATRPRGDSSSACEDCDDSSSSKAKSSSSSSVTPKSSDSETSVFSSSSSAKSSSSSAKSSSSAASSSSKDVEPVETSSSSSSVDSSSSSAKSSSSSVAYVEPCRTDSVDTCEYGTLTDERDGQTYKTVTIGTQIWMAENLNYAYTGVPYKYTYKDSSYTSDSTSWCYDNVPANCAKYGRLYTWAAAMDSVGTWSANGKGCGYLRKGNGIRCLPQSAGNRRRARCSSPQAAGMIIRGGGTATGRTPTLSRRCLLATGATMGVPTARATTRTSGVLLRAIATTRTTCT